MKVFVLAIFTNLFLLDNIYSSPPSDLCNYTALLNGAKTDNEKKEREEYYLKMLGVLDQLNSYRTQFIANGDLINLFPTIYYHTTSLEVDKIRVNSFKYPVEKMRQMLYFFDAYKLNRTNFNNNIQAEAHWQKHFDEVKSANANPNGIQSWFCDQIRKVLNSAVRAHVKYDLPRAIRYAFDNRTDRTISANMISADFFSTNSLFTQAQILSVADIKVHHAICGTLAPIVANQEWLGAISTSEIIDWRTKAFKDAIIFRNTLEGYGTPSLINQPSYFPHTDLFEIGRKYCGVSSSTMFLFDVSGSMSENNKWQNAKQSALSTLATIKSQANSANLKPSISIRAFDGECIADPTREVIDFTTNLSAVEDAINNKVPPPGGSTPLPQSIKISEEKLNAYLTANNIKKGKLIVLTDGVSSCGSLRPQGVYGYGQQGFQPAAKFNASGSSTSQIRYYAVGFGIAAGSEAERDLQYLVQTNGGKYLNAQNQIELTEAFYKFNRVYIPKANPSITTASEKDQTLFTDGLIFINDEEYDKALENYRAYIKTNDKDYNGIYNFALMSEANERYKAAIKNYELYLQLFPNATDKPFVLETLQKLRETAKRYATYNKQVVKSDMEYLDLYFKKVQNGESIALAIEFIGFLKEKYSYYNNLAAIVEVDDRLFKTNANEVFKGLKECVETINRNPQAWDRDATPVLSRTYLNMERLYNSF